MAGNDTGSMLTADERRFLRELFAESASADSSVPERQLVIEAEEGQDDFLRHLTESGRVRLLVDDDDKTFQYTLHLDPDTADAGALRLRARYPVLIDRRGRARSLRVRPREGEVRVRDASGRLQHPDVVDISTSGIYLSDSSARGLSSGVRFSGLDLRLPNHEAVRVGGRVVRVRRSGSGVGLAMEFDRRQLDRQSRTALRRYVFERYRNHA
ncbi:PilZ domain-containing protein [Aquisalimonas lutea]|uniref:PilZ domain-containing protein n=1 Tax=Aquisalimonas lutea TaxID=1327750 RepID=UPI0025B5A9D9|nr:PilZ domain-containing protein [Aquisalimonas lutea]MDN3518936.1 PilZ domain-containing protein [Aquisalimonas lutea]